MDAQPQPQPQKDLALDADTVAQELKIRKEIYLKIVASFSANFFGKLDALDTWFHEGNREEIRKILHEIRGTAGNLRLADIAAVESMMHDAVKGGEPLEKIRPRMADLRSEAERLRRFVAASVPTPGGGAAG